MKSYGRCAPLDLVAIPNLPVAFATEGTQECLRKIYKKILGMSHTEITDHVGKAQVKSEE